MKLDDIKVGGLVIVMAIGYGTENGRRSGIVTRVMSNIKYDIAGIDYVDSNGNMWWGYLDEVVSYTKVER